MLLLRMPLKYSGLTLQQQGQIICFSLHLESKKKRSCLRSTLARPNIRPQDKQFFQRSGYPFCFFFLGVLLFRTYLQRQLSKQLKKKKTKSKGWQGDVGIKEVSINVMLCCPSFLFRFKKKIKQASHPKWLKLSEPQLLLSINKF